MHLPCSARTRFIVFTFYLLGQFVERIFLHLLAPELRPVSPVCLLTLVFLLNWLGLSAERASLLWLLESTIIKKIYELLFLILLNELSYNKPLYFSKNDPTAIFGSRYTSSDTNWILSCFMLQTTSISFAMPSNNIFNWWGRNPCEFDTFFHFLAQTHTIYRIWLFPWYWLKTTISIDIVSRVGNICNQASIMLNYNGLVDMLFFEIH